MRFLTWSVANRKQKCMFKIPKNQRMLKKNEQEHYK